MSRSGLFAPAVRQLRTGSTPLEVAPLLQAARLRPPKGDLLLTGFTLLEIIVVVAIIGILAALILAGTTSSRHKANDNSIRSDIRQLRFQAELVYDSQGASYIDWNNHASVQAEVTNLLEDIDKQHGDTNTGSYVTTVRSTQRKEFCISAPLRAEAGQHHCVDASGVSTTVSSACPNYPINGTPLRCPTE